jgi:hypothetical protein
MPAPASNSPTEHKRNPTDSQRSLAANLCPTLSATVNNNKNFVEYYHDPSVTPHEPGSGGAVRDAQTGDELETVSLNGLLVSSSTLLCAHEVTYANLGCPRCV